MDLPRRLWTEMCWQDFQASDTSSWTAVLPVAAVEEHGPHLPLGVDRMIMEGYLARAMPLIPPALPVSFLPIQAVGKSNEHADFPGTLSWSAETAIRAWTEIGESVARTGVRKIVLLNSHGGNAPVIDIVARELRVRCAMLAVTASFSRFGYPEGLFSERERVHGMHAGEIETSLMMAFRPELVRRDRLTNYVPSTLAMERDYKWLRAGTPAGFGWMSQDINETGGIGDAGAATPEKGEAAAAFGAQALADLLVDVSEFPLSALAAGPLGRQGG